MQRLGLSCSTIGVSRKCGLLNEEDISIARVRFVPICHGLAGDGTTVRIVAVRRTVTVVVDSVVTGRPCFTCGGWGARLKWCLVRRVVVDGGVGVAQVIAVGVGGIWRSATTTVVEARLRDRAMFIEQAFDADASGKVTVTIGGTVSACTAARGFTALVVRTDFFVSAGLAQWLTIACLSACITIEAL